MSTSFEVYAAPANIPSFDDILSLSNRYLKEKLAKHGIYDEYIIDVSIRKITAGDFHDFVSFDKKAPALWPMDDGYYAWFTVGNTPGGCDAYIYKVGDFYNMEFWEEELKLNERAKAVAPEMRKCLENGFYWSFRRSMGQYAIVNLSYGLVAAAFAELMNGFIFSDDSAWDYNIFPADAATFLQHYFDPEYSDPRYASWAKQCIDAIKG